MIGQTVSHYRITEKLGEGGMGVVYKAWNENLERYVALKFLPPTLTRNEDAKKRFIREAKAASALDHHNVIVIHDIDEAPDGQLFIAMAYYDGVSIRKRLEKGPLETQEAVDVALQAARGLAQAHTAGIVHRDIKPANLISTQEGVLKIVDFGLAKLKGQTRLTGSGITPGTVGYMSPEQARAEPVDARSDIFSLSVVVYEMLTGEQPFAAEQEVAVLYRTLNEPPRPLTEVNPALPAALQAVVERGLSKDPKHRYHNISEMIHDLEIIHRQLEQAVTHDDALIARRRWSRRARRRTAVTAALVILVLAGRYIVPVFRGDRPSPRIMVVKWDNTFERPELDWISGAVMSELIRTLGHLDGYHVISRQTVAATVEVFEPKSADVSPISLEAAGEVGASYLISGAFAPSGAWIRLECEASDVGRGGILIGSWSAEIPDSTRFHTAVVDLALHVARALGATWREDPQDAGGAARPQTASIDALKYYQRALEAYELGDIPSAMANLRSAVREDSTFTEAHLLIARLAPETAEQEEHLTLAMKYRLQSTPTVRSLVEAEHLAFNEQFESAIERYEAVVADNPEQVTARKALALLYRQTRRFSEAASEYSVLRRISPFDYSFYRDWAMTYVEIDRRDKATALIADWQKRFPTHHVPVREIIFLAERIGNYAEGQVLCDSLAQADPESVPFMCAWLLFHLGRLNEAEHMYRELVQSPDPFVPRSRGFAYLAYLCYRRADYVMGLDFIEQALAHQEEAYYLWIAGLLAAGAGRIEQAERYAERIARYFESDNPDDPASEALGKRRLYHHVQGEIALAQNDPGAAVASFQQVMEYTSRIDDPYFRTYLGYAHMQAGELQRAEEEFEHVLRTVPTYPRALLYLGQTHILREHYDGAGVVLAKLKALWKGADADDPLNQELNRLIEVAAAHK